LAIFDLEHTEVGRIEPDATCEVQLMEDALTLDVMIEMDLTERPSYNLEKLYRYDAFLTGWWHETRRYAELGTQPVIVFVCRTAKLAEGYARAADKALLGCVGVTGSRPYNRQYPGREHIFFANETDIYNGDLGVLALPALPPDVRHALDGTRDPALARVELFPERIIRAGQRLAKELASNAHVLELKSAHKREILGRTDGTPAEPTNLRPSQDKDR
jgi:hypothetical protein